MPHASELLAAYDVQLRDHVHDRLPVGACAESDGPLLRLFGLAGRGFVVYRDLGGLEGADLDDLIARQVRVFAERGERFEWKLHGHDLPPDLPRRLRAAGFVPEDEETVVIAPVDEIAGLLRLPERVSLREVTERSDFDRIAAVQPDIWQEDGEPTWLAESLEGGEARGSALSDGRGRGGGRRSRLRRLGEVRAGNRLRDVLGWRDGAGLARARCLPSNGRVSG